MCKNKDLCKILKGKILGFNQHRTPDKMSYIIYADIKYVIKNIDECANNPENFSTTKIVEHISCGYLTPTIWTFNSIKNKRTLYRGVLLYFFIRTSKSYN